MSEDERIRCPDCKGADVVALGDSTETLPGRRVLIVVYRCCNRRCGRKFPRRKQA